MLTHQKNYQAIFQVVVKCITPEIRQRSQLMPGEAQKFTSYNSALHNKQTPVKAFGRGNSSGLTGEHNYVLTIYLNMLINRFY